MMTDIPRQWLRRKGTPQEFERARLERTAEAFQLPMEKVAQKFADRPFGEMTGKWRDFLKWMEPNDELWSFSSPDEAFAKRLGCQGFAIVRDGVIQGTLITLQT